MAVCCAELLKKTSVKESIEISLKYALKELTMENYKEELKEMVSVSSLAMLQIDRKGEIGYTFKTLGVAVYALSNFDINDISSVFHSIMKEGGIFRNFLFHFIFFFHFFPQGDADTNLAVSGSLIGGFFHHTFFSFYFPFTK